MAGSYNHIVLVGRLVADPELRQTQDGVPVTSFRIAVNRPKSRGGQEQTDFFGVSIWRQRAETAAKYLQKGRPVLIAGRNFGSGSSREHAVWALQDYGIRAVVAPSFSDIFYSNALKGGLLPVQLPEAVVERWLDAAVEEPGLPATVDLDACTVSFNGETQPFEIDAEVRHRLREGLDDISLTLHHDADIAAFEQRRPAWLPRTTALSGS